MGTKNAAPAAVIQDARAFTKWIEKAAAQAGKDGADADRMRIAMAEGLRAPVPHGDKDRSALDHALHCMNLVALNVNPEHGGVDREPESALVYLAYAVESLEATLAAVTAEIDAADAEAGLRAMRRADRRAKGARS